MSDQVTEAKEVATAAVERAGDVVGDVGVQAKAVARDAQRHARDLVQQGRRHLEVEANERGKQAAGGLRTLSDQLGALAAGDSEGAGALGDYARQGREQLARLADRLDEGPGAVLDDIRRFARRQPVVFLAAAGALGFLAGRLARGVRDADDQPAGNGAAALPPPGFASGPTAGVGSMPVSSTGDGAPSPLAATPTQVEGLAP